MCLHPDVSIKSLKFLKYVVHMSLFRHFLLWAFNVFAQDNFSIPADDFRNKPFNQIYSRKAETNFPEIVIKNQWKIELGNS